MSLGVDPTLLQTLAPSDSSRTFGKLTFRECGSQSALAKAASPENASPERAHATHDH